MLEDLDLNSIADDGAREFVRQLLNLLEDVMATCGWPKQRTNACATRSTGSRASRAGPRSSRTSHNCPARTTPRNTNGVNPRGRRKAARWTYSIDREQVVQIAPDCLPPDAQFKGTRTWWCRTSSSVPTMSCSIKRSFTPRRSIRRIWRLCPKATTDSSALGSRAWRWCSTMGADERAEGGRAVAQCRRAISTARCRTS